MYQEQNSLNSQSNMELENQSHIEQYAEQNSQINILPNDNNETLNNKYQQKEQKVVASNKNPIKNKKMILIFEIAILVLIIAFIIGFNIYNNLIDKNNNIKSDTLLTNQLKKDFDNKKITADEFVRYSLYAQYDKDLLNKNYKGYSDSLVTIHTDELIDKYYDELSDETLKYYLKKVNLDNVTFELNKENEENKVAISDLFIENVYAKENKTTNLNKAFLSKRKNFIVWYTTTGDSATDFEFAKKIGNGLEDTIGKYRELFNTDYKYQSEILSKGKTYDNQSKILKAENIDSKYLESAMHIYLVNYNEDTLAKYFGGSLNLQKIWDKIRAGDKYGSIIFPYILIKPSSFDNFENLEQLYNHEMFHHYQNNILCNSSNCGVGNDPYIGDATANWASALVTKNNNKNGLLNKWAGTARKYASNFLSDEFINKNGIDSVGYTLFPYIYNYSTIVFDGTNKVLKSIYEKDALKYLKEQATSSELAKIQSTIAYKHLAQNYSNNNLIVDINFNTPIQIKEIITAEKYIDNTKLNKLGIEYYLLDVSSNEQQYEIELIRDNENIGATLIGEKDGEYKILDISSVEDENFVFDTNYYEEYSKIYISVYNILPTLNNYYSLEINKTNFKSEEELISGLVIDEKLKLNGFEFELGIKLEDFVNGTKAVISQADLEKAKLNTNSFSSLYSEIATFIYHGDHEIEFDIFVDTTDLNNITVEGISISSDLGWETIDPGGLGKPNLVTCGFQFLGGYDINTTTFHDLDKKLRVQADLKKDEYSNKYKLMLRGEKGFGITINFSNLRKNSDTYYIYYIDVTRNTGLLW